MRHPGYAALCVLLLTAGGAATCGAAGAQSFGNSFNGLQVKGDQPIAIDADQLDVDDKQRIATFTGNVEVAQGDTLLKTAKLLVYYAKQPAAAAAPSKGAGGGADAAGAANAAAPAAPAKTTGGALPGGSNQIDRLDAEGKLYVRSADQVATAERGTFDMKTQIAVLSGNVVMSQGDNVARGDKLTIHMDSGLAQLGGSGRVKILMAPEQNGRGAQSQTGR